MKEGKYLSEAIDYSEIKRGRLNMVVAKTGQGKTTMATQSLPQRLNIINRSRVLYLIDTNSLFLPPLPLFFSLLSSFSPGSSSLPLPSLSHPSFLHPSLPSSFCHIVSFLS